MIASLSVVVLIIVLLGFLSLCLLLFCSVFLLALWSASGWASFRFGELPLFLLYCPFFLLFGLVDCSFIVHPPLCPCTTRGFHL